MSAVLSADARVHAARSFARDLQAAQAFLSGQDPGSGSARFQALLAQLEEVRTRLRFNPEMGRPARFPALRSAQAQAKAVRASGLAAAHGVPVLRELILRPYVLLYAHGDKRVVLLALKHERQMEFRLA